MHDVSVASFIPEYSTSIILKSVGHSDTTSYGSALINLLEHVLLASQVAVLIHAIHVVLVRYEAVSVWVTILAHVNRCALDAIIVTARLVNRASLIGDVCLAHELEGTQRKSTMATVIVH